MDITKQNKIFFSIIILVVFGIVINQFLAINILRGALGIETAKAMHLTGDIQTDAQILAFPKGQPRIYGREMGVMTYPDPRDVQGVEASIKAMRAFEAMVIAGDNLERYIKLGTIPTIACEFCCSVKVLVNKDGSKACGCAHSYAMRGLMKYLIEYHGEQFSDDEILQEMARWKAIYFPKQMMKRYIEQAETGQFTPDMAALIHNVEVKKGAKVKKSSVIESIDNLPDMAGGC